jgi:hypothetical protein
MILRSLYVASSSDSDSSQEDLPQPNDESSDSQVENGQTDPVNTSSLAPKAQKDSYIRINQVTPDVSPENISPNGVPGALQCIWLAMVVAAASLGLAIKHYRSAK